MVISLHVLFRGDFAFYLLKYGHRFDIMVIVSTKPWEAGIARGSFEIPSLLLPWERFFGVVAFLAAHA